MARAEFFGVDVDSRDMGKYRLSLREYDGHAQLPAHTHGEAFVTIVIDGGFREESRAAAVDCVTHNLLVHAPGDRHMSRFIGRRTRCLSVQGGTFTRSALLATPSAAAIALKVIREFRHPDSLSPIVLEALMLELFVATERFSEGPRRPHWLTKARAILDSRFQESLTMSDLAESLGVHPSHLARGFRLHYGTTVGEMLRDLRVAYARQRLESSAPLQAIACDAGFADQSHFTRTFRRSTGMTPAQYRRALLSF